MRFKLLIILSALSLATSRPSKGQQTSLPSANDVVAQMVGLDAERQRLQEGYEGMRKYTLVNEHMHKRAEMVVRVSGEANGTKHFEIVSANGWKAAQKHVLKKMLESEEESSLPAARRKSRLCSDNYEFQMVGTEATGDRTAYVIEVTPKRHEKYLFRGRIWVDAEEYALVRADGNPAKNPSFWTKSVHFVHGFQKQGAFWFPLTTESVTEARLFGTTNLKIEYFDYRSATASEARDSTEMAKWGTQP